LVERHGKKRVGHALIFAKPLRVETLPKRLKDCKMRAQNRHSASR
jgi:hypothetical protein